MTMHAQLFTWFDQCNINLYAMNTNKDEGG